MSTLAYLASIHDLGLDAPGPCVSVQPTPQAALAVISGYAGLAIPEEAASLVLGMPRGSCHQFKVGGSRCSVYVAEIPTDVGRVAYDAVPAISLVRKWQGILGRDFHPLTKARDYLDRDGYALSPARWDEYARDMETLRDLCSDPDDLLERLG